MRIREIREDFTENLREKNSVHLTFYLRASPWNAINNSIPNPDKPEK